MIVFPLNVFHVHGHVEGLIVIYIHAISDFLAILHGDGLVADLLQLVTLIFFFFWTELLFWVLCILRFGLR